MKQLMWSRNRPLALRVLVLLLALIVLAASPLNTFCQAHAFAAVAEAAAGVVALLLVAGGYTFANQDTLTECAWNLWQGMSGELKSGILSVATIWAENQGQVNLWKVSASLKDMFLDYLGLNYDPENAYVLNTSRLITVAYDNVNYSPSSTYPVSYYVGNLSGGNLVPSGDLLVKNVDTGAIVTFSFRLSGNYAQLLRDGEVSKQFKYMNDGDVASCAFLGWFFARGKSATAYSPSVYFKYQVAGESVVYYYLSDYPTSASKSYLYSYNALAEQIYDFPVMSLDDSKLNFKDLPDEPVLQLPATTNITNIYNTTYADVTSPSYQLDQSEIAALPADVPTVRTDTGTGEGTDTPETPVVPALPTAPSFVDGLTLPATSWTEKFPFSIPFDAVRIFSQLQVEPIKPVFVIPYKYGSIVDEQITIDLSKFEVLFAAIKWLTYVVFLLGLMQVTRSWIKW